MPFNINEFESSFKKNGASRTDLFEVLFTDGDRDLTYRARSVNLPGRNINILEYFELGPEYKLGSFSNYQDISIQFICSEDLLEREYFLIWQDKIVGNHRNQNGLGYLQENYYREYVRRFDINIYNESALLSKTVTIIDAFPTTVGDISYDWNTSEYATIDVSFAYRHFETDLHYNYSLRKNDEQRALENSYNRYIQIQNNTRFEGGEV
jgi:hypothetical protein